jgi:DNA-binding NarL/FixJ family response regulator
MNNVERSLARVLIVEHNLIMRAGLCSLVSRQPDTTLVGVATSAREAVQLSGEHRPTVILVDLDFPDSTATGLILKLHELDPAVCIIGLYTYPWDDSANLALDAGARACIAKDRLNLDLVQLIAECLRSEK